MTKTRAGLSLTRSASKDIYRVLKGFAAFLTLALLMSLIGLGGPSSAISKDMSGNGYLSGNDNLKGVWADLKQMVYKDRTILPALTEVSLKTPYRAKDDRRVPIDVKAKFDDGRTVKKVTIIIDENPMPVSAIFEMKKQRKAVKFATHMRFNGPSPIRVIVEASDGKLYMKEQYVKTSGLGACAAPPIGDPKKLLVNLGTMKLEPAKTAENTRRATQLKRAAHLQIKHPNLTGLQMDQITLQYILARFIKTIEVAHGKEDLFSLTASISLSENPDLTFDYLFNGSEKITVKAVDTDDTKFEKSFPVGLDS